jgi:hypothetical protein
MEAFMQEFVPPGDGFAIFDGTSMVCHSRNLREAQRGYNPRGRKNPQVNPSPKPFDPPSTPSA